MILFHKNATKATCMWQDALRLSQVCLAWALDFCFLLNGLYKMTEFGDGC